MQTLGILDYCCFGDWIHAPLTEKSCVVPTYDSSLKTKSRFLSVQPHMQLDFYASFFGSKRLVWYFLLLLVACVRCLEKDKKE